MNVERGVRRVVLVVSLAVFGASLGVVAREKSAFRQAIVSFQEKFERAEKQLDKRIPLHEVIGQVIAPGKADLDVVFASLDEQGRVLLADEVDVAVWALVDFTNQFPAYQGWGAVTLARLISHETPRYAQLFAELMKAPMPYRPAVRKGLVGITRFLTETASPVESVSMWGRRHMLQLNWGTAFGISVGLAAVPWGLFFVVRWIVRGFGQGATDPA